MINKNTKFVNFPVLKAASDKVLIEAKVFKSVRRPIINLNNFHHVISTVQDLKKCFWEQIIIISKPFLTVNGDPIYKISEIFLAGDQN